MKVSVIIPMYNAEGTILKCLESVVNQLPSNEMEVIVVNDGSKDSSVSIVEKYISDNNYNIKLYNQNNKGVSAARNFAILKSTSSLIALIDSDDIWLANKLKHQLEVLNKYDVDFVGSLYNNIPLGFPYKLKGDIFEVSLTKMLIKMAPSTITALFKKSLIEKAGYYDENQKYTEDGNLWMRFSKLGKMIILNKNYAIAGDLKPTFGHTGLSGNLKGMFEGELKNLKDILKLRYINLLEYYLYKCYFLLKYKRRVYIVNKRKK